MCDTTVKTSEFKETKEPLFSPMYEEGELTKFIRCGNCKSSMNYLHLQTYAFSQGVLNPSKILRCPVCGAPDSD